MTLRAFSLLFVCATLFLAVLFLHPKNPLAAIAASPQSSSAAQSLILQENDGERFMRRPGGQSATGPALVSEFMIKIDKQNGHAEDFVVLTETLQPGAVIDFHKHHNAEEVLILEEAGATVTVGEKRSVTGPHAVVFIPRETWIGLTNTATHPIHLYALFSRPGIEEFLRARAVHPGEPVTPMTREEMRRAMEQGHAMDWDTSKGTLPPGVPHD